MATVRVAHLMNSMDLGGVTTTVYHLLRGLPRDRYELHLGTLKRPADRQSDRALRQTMFEDLGIPITLFDQDRRKAFVIGDLGEWLTAQSIDILHTHSYKPNLYGRLAALVWHRPTLKVVSHYHNRYDRQWDQDGSLPLERQLVASTDRIVACSEWVREHLTDRLNLSPEDITVVANGVDSRFFSVHGRSDPAARHFGCQPHERVVGIVGRLCEQKAHDVFLHAAKLLLRRQIQARFLIAGSGSAQTLAHLTGLASTLGLKNSTTFLGHIADMPTFYSALDVLAMPSRWEGLPLTLLEAMAAGVPVVASDIPAISQITDRSTSAVLVPPDDPEALASQMALVLQHPEFAKRLRSKGRERARVFAWEHATRCLDVLYQELRDSQQALTAPKSGVGTPS